MFTEVIQIKAKVILKILRKRTTENETIYKKYKYLFEKIKKKSKTSYYQRILKLFEGDINKTWKIIKEVHGKKSGTCDSFPKKLLLTHLTTFFVKIGPNLASKNPKSDANLEAYITKANTKLHKNPLMEDEFLESFKSLKISKAPGFDQIDVNVINQKYNHIKKPLIRIFGDWIKLRVFLENLKLAKVTPIFKSGKKQLSMNYTPILLLPYLLKLLEWIMYNRLYKYLSKNNLLFYKQFGFRKGHSTKHALTKLVNGIYDSFKEYL